MKKSTKGLVAAGAAAALLLGGAGTLAYWTADDTVDGGTLSSGSIVLGTPECGEGWVHSTSDPVRAVDQVVPGDTIALTCTVTLDLEGDNIGATLEITEPTTDGALASLLDFSTVTLSGTGVVANEVSGSGEYVITATVTAEYPYGTEADNSGQGITDEDLGELELVAVQTNTLN